MKTLYMTKGLPGSGKTTWANQMIDQLSGSAKRVNKDDLRRLVDNGKWSTANEKTIISLRDTMIEHLLSKGFHVIVDDTNLAPKHEDRLCQIAKANGAAFKVEDFTHVSIETCIKNDLNRLHSVGEKVIRSMHRQFLEIAPVKPPYDPLLQDCFICDIDGTVALMNGRGPYEGEKCDTDIPNEPIVHLVRQQVIRDGQKVIFVSGRFEAVREKTLNWLATHVLPDYMLELYMRPNGDERKDNIIKREIYESHIKGKYNVRFVLDDRNRVVEEWRRLGLTVLQVADGDF